MGLQGVGGKGCRVQRHEVAVGWWEQGYDVTVDWQTAKCEPEGHADLKEVETWGKQTPKSKMVGAFRAGVRITPTKREQRLE